MTTPPPPAIQLPAPRLSAPMALPESFTVLVVDDQRSVRAALKAGAKGYLPKNAAAEELVFAISSILAGKTYLSPSVIAPLMAV